MLLASITGSVTDWLTSLIGDYGLYAVFLLMVIDAVLPAASELVMLYAGALAAGAFPGQDVVLFGSEIEGFWAYFAMSMAGVVGNTVGSVIGWWIGYYGGRPLIERHGRWLHLGPENVERAEKWFERWGDWAVFLGRVTPVVRSFVSIPAGVAKMPLAALHGAHVPGLHPLVLRDRGSRLCARHALRGVPPQLPVRGLHRCGVARGGRGRLVCPSPEDD